jgi:hypothetical protein
MSIFVPVDAGAEFESGWDNHTSYGDFYCGPDDVTRGITLFGDYDLGSNSKADGLKIVGPLVACMKGEKLFHYFHIAPILSQDIAMYLSLTTVQLDSSAVETANKLISFFTDEVRSQINKVDRGTFTIKSEVIVSGLHCETKVRIYQDGHASCVEFQKRSGDTIAFNRMYGLAKKYLQDGSEGDVQDGLEYNIPAVDLPAGEVLRPLLEIIEHSQDVDLLAEAASGLAEAVKDPKIAVQMRQPCALSALRELRQLTDFRVADPTSQVLALCPLF